MKTIICCLISLFVLQPAMAEKYSCEVIQTDPWNPTLPEDVNRLFAEIDLSKGTVELSAEYEASGDNPYAVLLESSPRGYAKGTRVFRGKDRYEKTVTYMVAFSGAGDYNEWRMKDRSYDELHKLECKLDKKKK
jgi:hypothetical protein